MSTLSVKSRQPLTDLRWQWSFLLAFCLAILGFAYSLLSRAWDAAYARQWLAQAAAFSIFPLWVAFRGLPANHRKGETGLLPTLGAGNLLSITRGLLIAWLAGFLLLPRPGGYLGWVPGSLFSLMILADIFDGYLARSHDQVTLLGDQLDMNFDGIAVLVGSLLLVQYGQSPGWYVLVGLARYLFLMGSWLRRRRELPVYDLPENPVRRQLAGSQMGFIAVLLFPAFAPPGTRLAAALFALPFLAGFLLDWLAVIGRRVDLSGWKLSIWLPVAFRILVASLVVVWLTRDYSIGMLSSGLLGTAPGTWMLVLAIAGSAMVAFGAAGRLAALGVLFSMGISQQFGELGAAQIWIILAATAVFYLGTGPYSLWVPERTVLIKRPGEK
jgi:CDP-diacylglycerol--glycerol-3-phosphate 3-phosphatidyltransferase